MSRKKYKYIWSTVDDVIFKISSKISPYFEINEDIINDNLNKNEINVNPYLRFFHIFCYSDNLYKNKIDKKYNNFKEELENMSLHFLRKLDFVRGMNVIDVFCDEIIYEIENGKYGKSVKDYINMINIEEKKTFSILLCNKIMNNSIEFAHYENVLNEFFKDNIIYKSKENKRKIIIYINYNKNRENIAKINIINHFFLPLGYETTIYWKNHFGVVNIDEVMILNKLGVF